MPQPPERASGLREPGLRAVALVGAHPRRLRLGHPFAHPLVHPDTYAPDALALALALALAVALALTRPGSVSEPGRRPGQRQPNGPAAAVVRLLGQCP